MCLLPGRSEEVYRGFLDRVVQLSNGLNPVLIMTDFEMAAIRAMFRIKKCCIDIDITIPISVPIPMPIKLAVFIHFFKQHYLLWAGFATECGLHIGAV